MRLICPNCGAQYAVADDVIPTEGRDVQCSNCAHTWFEVPGASENDGEPKPRRPRSEPAASTERIGAAPKPPSERRKVDPSVADILREEAARETQRRQAETPPSAVESQSDLGLSDPPRKPRPAPEPSTSTTRKTAETAAMATGAVAGSAAKPTSVPTGRDRLPDIEEINSSLSSDDKSDHASGSPDYEARQSRGFRRAFFLVLLIFAALVAIYVQADAIKTAMPDLAGVVDSYVSTVDAGRIWLDDTVRNLFGSAAPEAES